MLDCNNKDALALYHDMVSFYGDLYNFSPLQAKVYVYLIFDTENAGLTFEELTQVFNVSKSSMSAALKNMLASQHIEAGTPLDSRKRFFRINKDYTFIKFSEVLKRLNSEKKLLQRFIRVNKTALNKKKADLDNIKVYIENLDNSIDTINQNLKSIHSL